MNIILEPTVTVIAATQFFGHPTYAIPADGDHAERLGAFAAKSCYDSFGVDGRSVVDNQVAVLRERHGSVLEHAAISVFVEGFSRGCSLEVNRHRHFAISQRSTRYTAEDAGAIVLNPTYAAMYREALPALSDPQHALWKTPEGLRTILTVRAKLRSDEHALEAYVDQVRRLMEANPLQLTGVKLRKWARGCARDSLPHALETRAVYTGNWRTWRHFLAIRSAIGAESEVRRLAVAVYDALEPYAGSYFSDAVVTPDATSGIPEITFTHGRV